MEIQGGVGGGVYTPPAPHLSTPKTLRVSIDTTLLVDLKVTASPFFQILDQPLHATFQVRSNEFGM